MAERRMFSKRIISSDAFMDMSASAQMLYFHLSMWADDEGFVNNPKTIQRMCGADSEDMSALITSGLVIRFESGIVAIKHWKTHNYIRGDRIKLTYCAEEKAQLTVVEDGVYALAQQDSANGGNPADDNEQPYSDYGAEYSTNSGAGADNSEHAKDSTLNGSGAGADNSEHAKDSTLNANGVGAESYAQAVDSALNGNGARADNSAQAKDSTLNSYGTGAESYAQAENSTINGDNNTQAESSTLNGNSAGAESSAQAESSTLNGNSAGAESYAQAKNSTINGNSAGADNSAQAKDSTLNGSGAGAESYAQVMDSARNGNNSTQAVDSTRKSESCDRATLIERYGIDNVLDYEERFRKWAEKRGRQGMPLYPTISAWMKQDNVVNRREYSSIPDYYLSDDFLLEGY